MCIIIITILYGIFFYYSNKIFEIVCHRKLMAIIMIIIISTQFSSSSLFQITYLTFTFIFFSFWFVFSIKKVKKFFYFISLFTVTSLYGPFFLLSIKKMNFILWNDNLKCFPSVLQKNSFSFSQFIFIIKVFLLLFIHSIINFCFQKTFVFHFSWLIRIAFMCVCVGSTYF